MVYTIDEHGDPWEKRFHPHLIPYFPFYDEFWRAVIVPSTMREINGDIELRPDVDRDFELLVMSHYSCYCHLGMASEMIDQVSTNDLLYDDFFFHLAASIEMVDKRFLVYCAKIFAQCGLISKVQDLDNIFDSEWKTLR